MIVDFPYDEIASVEIPDKNLLGVYMPKQEKSIRSPLQIIKQAFSHPINSQGLVELAQGCSRVVILCDDNTRTTPVKLLLPEILSQLAKAGITKRQISILVAVGTHRIMTTEELKERFGKQIIEHYHVYCHRWYDEAELTYLGTSYQGTEIWINRHVLEADLLIGVGEIVPHSIVGFSGGTKIVQPGVCGEKTTGQTHWLAAHYPIEQLFGVRNNPVRAEIDQIGVRVGLKFIINTIQDGTGSLINVVTGDPIEAHRLGSAISANIFGVSVPYGVDIVIVDSYPKDLVQWQAINGLFPAKLVVKRGGCIILVSPCPEGVDSQHLEILKYGYKSYAEVCTMVNSKKIGDLVAASQLARVGRVIVDYAHAILVSTGLDEATTRRIGFKYSPTVQDALSIAFQEQGYSAKVAILRNGSTILPIVNKDIKRRYC